jgi:hypothetical protein
MSQQLHYPLLHPVEFKDAEGKLISTLSTVTLKRPKGKQMRQVTAKGGMGVMVELVGLCGGLSTREVDELDGEDLMELVQRVADFLGASLATGKTS